MLGPSLGLLLSLLPAAAWAKETLTWLLRDLPPLTIFEGPERGQGAVDQMLAVLIKNMPEYEHSITRVNRARALQVLQGNSFACDPTLLWTPERARYIVFSMPSMGTLSNGLILGSAQRGLLEPFMKDGEADLKALLDSRTIKLGLVAERSYSTPIDDIVKQAPAESLSRHYGDNAVASLLQMQQLGRLQMVLGYWPEIRYLGAQQGLAAQTLSYVPIRGVARYQFVHVGCSDTELGREAVRHVNQLLQELRKETLPPMYARWLDAASKDEYLRDSHGFFVGHERQ
ncbi:TIGR02285 family protein [Pseudomonas sp. SDI]|uniref:TIGR02285 family protein n=1 Tax=Pseudomonas sp. SDI TaxID=2170734 RepID=UPI002114EBDE|nr:TIGR02285 family protein [Pseudomonas sp. SDI]